MSIALDLPGWTLRRWQPADAPALQAVADDERIAQWMSDRWPMPYTLADAQWWVGPGHAESGSNWALCLHDVPQGGCGLAQQSGFQRCNAELGWWLSPAHWGQGIASRAARFCVEQAFANVEVTRVFAPIHDGNIRSMRVAEKAGLKLESVQPMSALKQGRVITGICMPLTEMSDSLDSLFANNRRWAAKMESREPGFFTKLLAQQAPQYLWIGCSDSRVPANELVDLLPGELFVHRNVANVVVHADLNALSVIQFAVDVLNVLHIIVVGHSNCGGVRAALTGRRAGLVDNWLRHVVDVRDAHAGLLACIEDEDRRVDALVELNVLEQARNVCHTTVVKDAWARGQAVTVHGWVYGLHNGLLEDLRITAAGPDEVMPAFAKGLASVAQRYLPSPAQE